MISRELTRLVPRVLLEAQDGEWVDLSGFNSLKCRLQVGAADELTINISGRTNDGKWRKDQPIWQNGSTITVYAGYGTDLISLQTFEVVETSSNYDDDDSLEIFAVSSLARAAQYLEARAVPRGSSDDDMFKHVASFYGWTPSADKSLTEGYHNLGKERGHSDLELLSSIAAWNDLGGPRVIGNKLILPDS